MLRRGVSSLLPSASPASALPRWASATIFTPTVQKLSVPSISAEGKSSKPSESSPILSSPFRSFRSSSFQMAAPTLDPLPAAPANSPSIKSIIQSHGGYYPLLGLGAVWLFSKEVMVWDPEIIMATNFAAVVFLAWTFGADTIKKTVSDDVEGRAKLLEDHFQLVIDTNKELIKAIELNAEAPAFLREVKSEYASLVTQVVAAKEMKARAAHRDSIVSRLQAIKQREESEKASYQNAVFDKTLAHVTKSFANLPKSQKDLLIDYAIAVAGGETKQMDSKTDPVKKLFKDYLSSKQYEKEIEADRAAEKAKAK